MNRVRPSLAGTREEWAETLAFLKQFGPAESARRLGFDFDEIPGGFFKNVVNLKNARAELGKWMKRAKHLEGELAIANADLTAAMGIREAVQTRTIALHPRKYKKSENPIVPIVCLGDWHVAEVVDPAKVNGLNKFNPEIAENRAHECARRILKLLEKERATYVAEEMIIHLQGDFMTGHLHPELAETNAMAPIEEAWFAKRLLAEVLETIQANAKMKKIRVITSRGNHGRTTLKKQFKNAAGTNYETGIYWDLQSRFTGPEWEWSIPASELGFINIHGPFDQPFKIRTYHGEQVRFQGGVGGLTVPLNKLQAKWNATIHADYNLMGHWHNCSEPNSETALNGSLKGYDEYALAHGFRAEPPLQTFLTFNLERRMMTSRQPIFCN